jgi:hypothetical protein
MTTCKKGVKKRMEIEHAWFHTRTYTKQDPRVMYTRGDHGLLSLVLFSWKKHHKSQPQPTTTLYPINSTNHL